MKRAAAIALLIFSPVLEAEPSICTPEQHRIATWFQSPNHWHPTAMEIHFWTDFGVLIPRLGEQITSIYSHRIGNTIMWRNGASASTLEGEEWQDLRTLIAPGETRCFSPSEAQRDLKQAAVLLRADRPILMWREGNQVHLLGTSKHLKEYLLTTDFFDGDEMHSRHLNFAAEDLLGRAPSSEKVGNP
ncbi:hypothetical protein [Ferrimonas balearica]|uniref:hypothetical protein n=1 Tax=Ferrimonas balearica TaxID=44012 RepID=UPI001C99D5A9|nr:hypothetical protein [Ferrimonas balearica]MBY5990954.1 hypothetical protein [Ferrimonas balearica]